VVLVVEENHGYEQVIGNSSMPFLNSLAQRGALATQYYANVHPSIGNYLELTTGAMATKDDTYSGVISDDNLAREITAAGKTWKSYPESLPSVGYLGGRVANYVKDHNPFAYFTDVTNNPAQAANIVPFTQFATDMAAGALPNFSFVVPNMRDNAHDCPDGTILCADNVRLAQADQWLSSNIGPLLSSSQFQNNGLLLVVFDEAFQIDARNGGGHVALVAVGSKVKVGAQSTTFYQHQNTLRTICSALALATCPGAGASVAAESDMFQSPLP
jgi:acid phosphatase